MGATSVPRRVLVWVRGFPPDVRCPDMRMPHRLNQLTRCAALHAHHVGRSLLCCVSRKVAMHAH
eukprot:13849720-Alexandrium_andersonii.AAC.1